MRTMSTCSDCAYGAITGARSAAPYIASSSTSAARVPRSKRRAPERSVAIRSANTNPRIRQRIRDVRQEVAHDDHGGTDQHGGEHQRIVAHGDGVHGHEAESGP